MKTQTKIVTNILLVGLMLISCKSITDLKTTTEFDENANFASYKSYKFFDGISLSDTKDNYSSENRRSIENAIHKQLKKKGMNETETPDLAVNFLVIDQHKSESMTHTSYQEQHYGGLTHLDTYIKDYEQGTLIIDLVDIQQNNLVWRGLGTGVITGNQEDSEDITQEAVKKILSKYPPKK